MKKFRIDIERSMRTTIDVIAISEESARQTAMEIAKRKGICEYQNYGHKVSYCLQLALTAKEKARMKREELRAFMKHYLHDGCDKQELSDIAFRGMCPNWFDHVKRENEPWQESFFAGIASGDDPKSDLYYRYARLAARWRFRSYYGGYNGFSRDLVGTSKEQRKQAVSDALNRLSEGHDEQIVIRYRDHETDSEDNYWNLFICRNDYADESDPKYYYAWQYVKGDGDDIDDFGSEYFDTWQELCHDLFYHPRYDDDCPESNMEHIWID